MYERKEKSLGKNAAQIIIVLCVFAKVESFQRSIVALNGKGDEVGRRNRTRLLNEALHQPDPGSPPIAGPPPSGGATNAEGQGRDTSLRRWARGGFPIQPQLGCLDAKVSVMRTIPRLV